MKKLYCLLIVAMSLFGCKNNANTPAKSQISQAVISQVISELKDSFPDADFRIERGVEKVARLWYPADGTDKEFAEFCKQNFIGDKARLDEVFNELSDNFEILYSHLGMIGNKFAYPLNVATGEITKLQQQFGSFDVGGHLSEDMYENKIAHYVALNFPEYTLEEMQVNADKWSAEDWAMAHLGSMFSSRVPSELNREYSKATMPAGIYVNQFRIPSQDLVDDNGQRPLDGKNLMMLYHWEMRDEIKMNYSNTVNGFDCQKVVYAAMLRVIDQSLPKQVINDKSGYSWNPFTNELSKDGQSVAPESVNNERYQHIYNTFQQIKRVDAYYPDATTILKRYHDKGMQMSTERIKKMLEEYISSPQLKDVAQLIKKRLGRDLQPFDIWYDGFKARSGVDGKALDAMISSKYPSPAAFEADIANILVKLGYDKEDAKFYQERIGVDPARGVAHAQGAVMKGDKSRLRTNFLETGMASIGFYGGMHELGHNVQQTIETYKTELPYFMRGIPNGAFTEATAFTFEMRNMDVLSSDGDKEYAYYSAMLDEIWSLYEMSGMALLEIRFWEWLYENPDATAAQINESMCSLSREIWNKYYEPVLGSSDQVILAMYNHMVSGPLYLANYAMGHIIHLQLEQYLKGKDFAAEIERIYVGGRLLPDIWMQRAVGSAVSIEKAMDLATEAIKVVDK